MNLDRDQIFEQALIQLAQGQSIDAISANFPEYSDLADELRVVAELKSIPISMPPAPAMRYKFAQKQSFWEKFSFSFGMYKFAAVPLAMALVIGSGYSVIHASENSLPGEKLYGVKLATEKARLQFTFDETKQASLHFELAKKRLNEARAVITLNNPSQEAAALNALEAQTEKTFAVASQLAANKAVSDNDQTLLDSLVAINKEKKDVLKEAVQSSEVKEAAETALNNSKEIDKDLARLIAAVSEQSLLDLPNKISVTGVVSNFGRTTVTVEKNQFVYNSETQVISQDGEAITDFASLSGQVAVIGTRSNNSLIAKKIVVIDPEATIAAEPTTATTSTPPRTVTAAQPVEPAPTSSTEETTEPEVPKTNEATAGFIVEPSTQQYAQ